ncbi:glucose-1-phosphatase-like [Danaus plexippus]|uniref:glucose-1-phosphatase-like n=1 Tax=Danaus plexippus TaxID=13037 RepID=UPI002AB20F9C|nr:glucose-1-phosphatase-like [Danaus plexippus]
MKNAEVCKIEGICNFDKEDSEITYEFGNLLNVEGSLLWANLIVDSFLMSYYDGFQIENVAWGMIKDSGQWRTLTRLMIQYQHVVFNSKLVGRQVSKPLLSYISSKFTAETEKKFISLHAHDANLYFVLAALEVEEFVLPEQYERTPIGGKLVFQRWHDATQDRDLFKLDFVYLTVDQIRDGSKLSASNPPRWVQLFFKDCPVDSDGFCSWEDFVNVLNDAASF